MGEFRMTKQADGGLMVEILVGQQVAWSKRLPAPRALGPNRFDLSAACKARRDAAAWSKKHGIELV